ncbi:MAG TPA: prepilin-type N-terminal cleavage/methylation domain-containing protein [Pyrinomonadaceae bacterium]|jgi:general secretion pathway protein G|nr:prepilin-type N-terminal cleavage/methylation domain-containing protein [Pyrinomonadaceae bacterium]
MRRATRIKGFTLIELVITVAVLAILTLGVIPLMQVSVKRQKEEQLRAALREMREAIDQFHREALAGAQYQASSAPIPGGEPTTTRPNPNQPLPNIFADPRVRVFITDQTIFSADNPDRYPPDLETLVDGVDVLPLTLPAQLQGGQGITGAGIIERTENSAIPKTKIYLRQLPIDPMTGKADWCVSSSYEPAEDSKHGCHSSGDGENVFNVHSRSEGEALDGTKYRDW